MPWEQSLGADDAGKLRMNDQDKFVVYNDNDGKTVYRDAWDIFLTMMLCGKKPRCVGCFGAGRSRFWPVSVRFPAPTRNVQRRH